MTFKCEACQKEFGLEVGLKQHNLDKHKEPVVIKKSFKFPTKLAYLLIGVIALFGIAKLSSGNTSGAVVAEGVPDEPVHWHPHLTIEINGENIVIPANVGLGSVHAPLHTHDATGTLHIENDYPSFKTIRLGYFFEVWNKNFNSECIFDYCTNETHEMKVFVNGVENFEYGDYVMQELDEIKITYSVKPTLE